MKLWYSFTKELQLSSKSYYFYIEIAMAFIFLVILLFVIPEKFSSYEDEYFSMDLPEVVEAARMEAILSVDVDGKGEETTLKLKGEEIPATLYTTENRHVYHISDRDTMYALTEADRPMIGAHLTWNEETNQINYEYVLQGYESEKLRNIYYVFHNKDVFEIEGLAKAQPVRTLGVFDGLNDRENVIPSFLTFNGSMMGMFIISAFIFLDRKEGILKAYAITASSVWEYLLSKVLVLMLVSSVTSLIIAVPIMKLRPNYPLIILLLLTSGFFFSTIGLLIASFFKGMTQSFGAIYVTMIIVMLPNIAYFVPSWDPIWIKFIPTYPLIQGFKESIVQSGDITFVLLSSLGFVIAGIALFLFTNVRYKKILAV